MTGVAVDSPGRVPLSFQAVESPDKFTGRALARGFAALSSGSAVTFPESVHFQEVVMARNTDYQASIASIENEINSLLDSLASLKKSAARESRSGLNSLKSTAREALHHSGDSLEEVYDDVRRLTRQYGRAASGVAREHPWATVGIAAGVTILVGWALLRGDH